jgi:hypothetical protein
MLLSSNHGNESASQHAGWSRAEYLHHNQAAADEYEDRGAHGRSCTSQAGEAGSMVHAGCDRAAERPVQRSLHQHANSPEQAASRPSALFDGLNDSLLPTPSGSGARDIEEWINRIMSVSLISPYLAAYLLSASMILSIVVSTYFQSFPVSSSIIPRCSPPYPDTSRDGRTGSSRSRS